MTNPFSWSERRTDIRLSDATDYAVDVIWTPGGGPAGIRCRRCSEPLVTLHHIDGGIPTQLLRDLVIATHHPRCNDQPVAPQEKTYPACKHRPNTKVLQTTQCQKCLAMAAAIAIWASSKIDIKELKPDTGDGRSLPCVTCGTDTPSAGFCCGTPYCDNCVQVHKCDTGDDTEENCND